MIRVYIGFDPRQPIAFQVAAHSIWERSSTPVAVIRMKLAHMPIQRRGLTDFTYSRFLVPYLCGYQGYSIFMDSDVLCLGDVAELYAIAKKSGHPVHVSKNKLRYEWSSVMVFNNAKCAGLTPEYVKSCAAPHSMEWAESVGELPPEWNHLVGYDDPRPDAKLVHYTQGIPCWPETQGTEYAAEWHREHQAMNGTVSFKELMGNSVHAQHVYKRLGGG